MTYGKFISSVTKFATQKGSYVAENWVKDTYKYVPKINATNLVKGSYTPVVDKITTNTSGRILRMQDAKDVFILGNRNGVALTEKAVMTRNPNIHLTTSDNFLARFRQMWSDINPTEILKQRAQQYNDLCYLFGKVNIK